MWCQFISDHFIANSKKTQAMILGNSAQEPALCVGDFPIKINHFSNILGIYINNKLSFKDHISATISVYVEIEALLRCLKKLCTYWFYTYTVQGLHTATPWVT